MTSLKDRARTQGYALRGKRIEGGAVISKIPSHLEDGEQSICGLKGFMVDEVRSFELNSSEGARSIACAAVACLEIMDSPIHVHGETLENYIILEGEGEMVLDNQVVQLSSGMVVTIPPGVEHGAYATTGNPIKVLMTFSPGLAPKEEENYRDEKILHPSSRERGVELLKENQS
ncbi:MAG: cupin domain-containing protein [Verrucomicrobiota bacterium]